MLTVVDLLSNLAKSRNSANTQNETLGIQGANAANNAELGFDQFNLMAPGERLRQSRVADIGSRAQPVTAGAGVDPASGKKVVKWEGGVNTPNLYSPETNQLASEMEHQHLADQLAGPKKPTPIPPIGRSDTMDKVLGAGSLATTGLSIAKILGLFGGGGKTGQTPAYGGYFDDAGNWVQGPETDPSNARDLPIFGSGQFPVLPQNPNHD